MIVSAFDQGGEVFLVFGQGHRLVGADNDDDIVSGGEILLQEPDGFTEHALGAIALNGGADSARDAQAPSVMGKIVGPGIERQRPAGLLGVGGVDGGESALAAEAVRAWKFVGFGRHSGCIRTGHSISQYAGTPPT